MSVVGLTMAPMNSRSGKQFNGDSIGSGTGGGGRDRGQNINHLLAFTLPPRARPPPPTSARRSKRNGGTPFNKERYVAAQYRFLVKPTGDYTAYFADADIYLNWGDILSVLIPTSSALSGAAISTLPSTSQPSLETHEGAACPICLSPPTAPRMTKCGHVYCYPCILQYLSTTDGPASAGPTSVPGAAVGASIYSGNAVKGPTNRQWKRCPICWDAVYARDLKAVRWWDPRTQAAPQAQCTAVESIEQSSDLLGHFEDHDDSAGLQAAHPPDHLSMRLMEKPQITTLALPQSSTWPTSSTSASDQPLLAQHQAPWHFQPDVMTFCKFMLATPDLLLESLTQDIDELAAERKLLSSFGNNQGDDSLAYVTLAEKKVSEQMGKVINELDTPAVRSAIGQAKNDLKEHEEAERGQRVRETENLSRRRRRRREREAQNEQLSTQADRSGGEQATTIGAIASDLSVSGAQDDERADVAASSPLESSEGAEAFLALRAKSQGGSYVQAPKEETSTAGSLHTSSDEAATAIVPPSIPKAHQRPRRNLNPPAPSSSSYLFYQAASGQNIYLHPLDIKVLHSQFGAYSRFPRDISVKVQGAEEGSMNEELQKRCKYLTHLPKGTDVVFIEVDWENMTLPVGDVAVDNQRPHLVEEKTLKPYMQVLRARRNKRRDRERKEDRAKLKSEEAEAAARPGGAGAAAAAAARHYQQTQASSANNSYTSRSMLAGSYESEGGRSALSNFSSSHGGTTAVSPSFMEAALWGAEREFPIHPGHTTTASEEEEFPAAIPSAPSPYFGPSLTGPAAPTNTSINGTARDGPVSSSSSSRRLTGTSTKKTVWGTPAAQRSSFSSTLHSSTRPSASLAVASGPGLPSTTLWDEEVDDAWLELEEGFVLGTNNARQVRRGKGLNSQQLSNHPTQHQHHFQHQHQHQQQQPAGGGTATRGGGGGKESGGGNPALFRRNPSANPTRVTPDEGEENSTVTAVAGASASGGADSASTSAAATAVGNTGKKQRRAKLILTAGGRGRG